jgi:hypothetical protein
MNEQMIRSSIAQWGGPVGVLLLLGTAAPWLVDANTIHAEAQARQTEAQQAQNRIEQGCQRLTTLDGKEVLLSPRMTPYDGASWLKLAPGTTVCDRNNNTAVIGSDGNLTDFKQGSAPQVPSPAPAPIPTPTASPTSSLTSPFTAPQQGLTSL